MAALCEHVEKKKYADSFSIFAVFHFQSLPTCNFPQSFANVLDFQRAELRKILSIDLRKSRLGSWLSQLDRDFFPIVLFHSFPIQQTFSVLLFCPWVLKYRKKSFASMKRQSSSNEERQNKEPRSCDSGSSQGSLSSTFSVKDILRRRIEQKQAQQNEELVSKSQENSTLTDWASMLSSAGFFCEVRSMVQSDLLPFLSESKAPAFALIVEQSEKLQFSPATGPFRPARLVLYSDGQWRMDSPILEYRKRKVGLISIRRTSKLSTTMAFRNARPLPRFCWP